MSDKELTNQGEDKDLDPEVIALFDRYFTGADAHYWFEQYAGLNRDGILKHVADSFNEETATTPEQEEQARSTIEYFETVLSQQPPFRLERTDDDRIQLLLTLSNRVVQSWRLPKRGGIDDELITLLGQSLKNLVAQHIGSDTSDNAKSPIEVVRSEFQALTGPGDASILERVRRAGGKLLSRRTAVKALKNRIGEGTSRDDLLERMLPDAPEDVRTTLSEKMNEQRPFRIECDKDGGVHVVLISSGERVHTWLPEDLGVPASRWRLLYYGAAVLLALLFAPSQGLGILGIVSILILAALLDGFLFLRRTRGPKTAWRAYWATAVLLLLIGVVQGNLMLAIVGVSMGGARFGYLWLWVKLVARRNILECPNCHALITGRAFDERAYSDSGRMIYSCAGCGTMAEPVWTGRRASFFWGNVE